MPQARVIIYGVGKVGSAAVRIMAKRKWIEIVGAIDIDKAKVGRDLGEVVGLDRNLGVIVSDDPGAILRQARAQVVIHTTSFAAPEKTVAQILQALEAGLNVISTTDSRLFFPWVHYPELGRKVDEAAKGRGVTFLGAGIIPGFVPDLIPITYSGACASVRKISIKVVAEIHDRSPSQLKYLGMGITAGEFDRGIADGSIHATPTMRYPPHIDLAADALGWKLDEVTRTVEPLTTKERIVLPSGAAIEPGKVCGYRVVHSGVKEKEAVIVMERVSLVGAKEEKYEIEIRIEGEPNIQVVTKGLKNYVCTAARAVNYIPQVVAARPGLVTIRELPVASALE